MEGIPDLGADARKRAAMEAEAAEKIKQAGELPLQVLYANVAGSSVQADGSVCIRLEYDCPAGTVPVADVIMPAAVFAQGLVGPGHSVIAAAAEQMATITAMLAGAVANRAAKMGGGLPGPDAVARARRQQAGDQ